MTPDEFRAALADLGFPDPAKPSDHGLSAFARWLSDHGHTARPATVARSVRRWAQAGPPGEAVVILSLLRERHPPPRTREP